jgi:uncharacterized protein (TIGR02679 family)
MLDRSIEDELREEHEGADVWAGVLPGRVLIPAYLVSRFAAQYRVIVDALLEAQDRSLTGMSFDDITAAVRDRLNGLLPPDTVARLLDEAVFHPEKRLDSLRRWGVLTRWQEPARSGEDFLRRRDRYQLTPIAARHHAFWSEADDSEDDSADMTLAPRAERGHSTERSDVRCELSAGERRQVGRLLGVPWQLSGRPVRLQDLAARLSTYDLGVLDLVVASGGPVTTHRDGRRALSIARQEERDGALALLVAHGVPGPVGAAWLDESAVPAVGRDRLRSLCERVVAVWDALPGVDAEPVRLSVLAAHAFPAEGAHGLDYDTTLGRAVARLAAHAHALERPAGAGMAWRRAWAAVRVLCDEVSSRVLCLNVQLAGTAPAVAIANAASGEPTWLTLRSLNGTLSGVAGRVFVCENPSVVEAAADALGVGCPPLVCTDGVPTAAVLELLDRLVASGCDLWVRADFDAAGLTIVETIRARVGSITPWRFDRGTYEAVSGRDIDSLAGVLPVVVHEEALLATLIDDLRDARVAG